MPEVNTLRGDTGTRLTTMADLARTMGPGMRSIVNTLSQENAALKDMPMFQCNMKRMHEVTLRTDIPKAAFRMINRGVPYSKGATRSVKFGTAFMEARAIIDIKQLELYPDAAVAARFMAENNAGVLEGMSQQLGETLLYGTAAKPAEFVGLSSYFDGTSETKKQIINGGSAAPNGNTSVWVIDWGEDRVHGLIPEGSKIGFSSRVLPEADAFDDDNLPFRAITTLYNWDIGLCVKDPRYVVRIANIDMEKLTSKKAADIPDVVDLFIQALGKLKKSGSGRRAIYAREEIYTALERYVHDKTKGVTALAWRDFEGEQVLAFRGIPIRQHDALSTNEKKIVLD